MSKRFLAKITLLLVVITLCIPFMFGCGDKDSGKVPSYENTDDIDKGDESSYEKPENTDPEKEETKENPGDETPATYTVAFESDGGTETASQQVKSGEKITKPTDPEKTNYVFNGWYKGDSEWNFETMTVEENVILTARWEADFTSSYLPRNK